MKMPNFDNVDVTYLAQCANSVMTRALMPVWNYSVPFVHQSISVLLPDLNDSRTDCAHIFVMSKRLAKELFFYGYMGALCGESHPLIRYAVAAASSEPTGNKLYDRASFNDEGVVGTLCGIPVFSSDSIGGALGKGQHCMLRLTVTSECGQPEYTEVKSIYVNPFYSDECLAQVEEHIDALAESNTQETIELVIPEEKTHEPDPAAAEAIARAADVIRGDMSDMDDENRRTAPNLSKEKYVSTYDRFAESEKIRTGKWPCVLMDSSVGPISLSWTAQALGENLAHVEWKDGTDSRLFLHVNDDMFDQHVLDSFDNARFADIIGIVLHNTKGFPYRVVDFSGVKYVSQTYKYVPGSKSKQVRVFTFSYATKVEVCL